VQFQVTSYFFKVVGVSLYTRVNHTFLLGEIFGSISFFFVKGFYWQPPDALSFSLDGVPSPLFFSWLPFFANFIVEKE